MKKRLLLLLLCACLSLCGCQASTPALTRYTYSFFGTFDTFISLMAYAPSQEAFDEVAALTERAFQHYHELFNAYNHSDSTNNVYELNNGAWKAPMVVDKDMMELLVLCRDDQNAMPNTVNIAMGRVLRLWHNAREHAEDDPLTAYLPDADALQEAALHTDMNDLILDEENLTVFYADPLLRLDLGAVAKGFAAGKVAEEIRALLPHFSLNAGGNIVVGEGPLNALGKWKAGIQDPDKALISNDETMLFRLSFNNQSLVTSGDYQRYFVVDGVRYHHIIDPVTLMPANHVRAVSILSPDAAMADYLSTAAFILPYEQSRSLIDSLTDTEAIWVLNDGTIVMTDGFAGYALQEDAA